MKKVKEILTGNTIKKCIAIALVLLSILVIDSTSSLFATNFSDDIIFIDGTRWIRNAYPTDFLFTVLCGGYDWGTSGANIVARGRAQSYNPHGIDLWTGNNNNPSLIINKYGNIGIGTINPSAKLDVAGTIVVGTSSKLYLGGDLNHPWIGSATNHDLRIVTYQTEKMRITSNGNVGIGTSNPSEKLEVAGTVAAQNYRCLSDARYKKNINPIRAALSKVLQLNGVTYDWKTAEYKEKGFTADPQIGLLAQNVETVFPELVHTDKAGYKSVSYDKMAAVLVEAFKEMNARQVALEAKNTELSRENESLKKRLASLEKLEHRMAALERRLSKTVAVK